MPETSPILREYAPDLDGPIREYDRVALLAALRAGLPPDCVHAEPEAMRPFGCDGLSAYRSLPALVVLPRDVEQVRFVMRTCHAFAAPVVARGAGTGLSGGALPLADSVLLVLSRLDRVLAIDADEGTATVEPGVRNLAISEAVAPLGLFYAPDPSSQIACTIGGNVAENAGGVHCVKYGLTLHNVVALQLVTVDGELVELGSRGLDACGPDLLALVCGSEGMLGVVTRVTVRLTPKPAAVQLVMAAFRDVDAAGVAVARIVASGVVPAGLEMMDALAVRAAEDFVHAGYPLDAAAILLCELDGHAADLADDAVRLRGILADCGAYEVRAAAGEEERLRLWSGRKNSFPAVGRLAPDYYCMDGTIPRGRLAEVLRGIGAISRGHGLAIANVFHAGDGNLHPLILYDANAPGQLDLAERAGAEILELCVAVGGTITGEHGVGREKLNQMCVQFSVDENATFLAVKLAFDPPGLLNPGKVIPTPRRCAEAGRMHVHGGRLPFPELERF